MVHVVPNIYTPITFSVLKQLRDYTRQLQQYIRYSLDSSYPDELYQKKAGGEYTLINTLAIYPFSYASIM